MIQIPFCYFLNHVGKVLGLVKLLFCDKNLSHLLVPDVGTGEHGIVAHF